MGIIWLEADIDPVTDEPSFTKYVSEGDDITMTMTAIGAETDGIEIFGPVEVTIIAFDSPDGIAPNYILDGAQYISNSINIPAINYSWVNIVNNIPNSFSTNDIKNVPDEFDFLTNVEPDPTLQKSYYFTLNGVVTGDAGTILNEDQTYTLIIQNNWDGDKASLAELMSKQR